MEAYRAYRKSLDRLSLIRLDYREADRIQATFKAEADRVSSAAQQRSKQAVLDVETALANGRKALRLVNEEDRLPRKVHPVRSGDSMEKTKANLDKALARLEADIRNLDEAKATQQLNDDHLRRESDHKCRERAAEAARVSLLRRSLVACGVFVLVALIAFILIL